MVETKEYFEEYLWLDPIENRFYWAKQPNSQASVGDRAGSTFPDKDGYFLLTFNNKNYYEHRLIWFWHYGYFPELIDHIDGNRTNNHILNLREATKSQNAANSKIRKDNKSGVKGVFYLEKFGTWKASIRVNSKSIHLGNFKSLEEAKRVRLAASMKYFGEFHKP